MTTSTLLTTRFAPSPTGALHLGHAYSARVAWQAAREQGGRFILRIEDIDPTRCRVEHEAQILSDLEWLGLGWDGEVRRQSEHLEEYAEALRGLEARGLVYPCFCTRKEIQREIEESGRAPHGPLGLVYPRTCRRLSQGEARARRAAGEAYAMRLDVDAALLEVPLALTWDEQGRGGVQATPERCGDVVLARKDTPTSYHLSVTWDDHLQGVTMITRGEDLFASTHVHRLLQALFGFDPPRYHHHPLLVGPSGRRFAKRNRSLTLKALREAGETPAQVWARVDALTPAAPSSNPP